MRFISHLDIQRLFRRALRRSGIELLYSQGYNPHPKINVVQPLSLGFETLADYFEIETTKEISILETLEQLNFALPEGIMFTNAKELPSSSKNLSSFVEFAEYEVSCPYNNASNVQLLLKDFLLQNEIFIKKSSKKTRQLIDKNVKQLIDHISIIQTEESMIRLRMVLRSASNESLNPLNILQAFYDFSNEIFIKESCHVMRIDLFFLKNEKHISLFDFTGI